jgi:predicted membrane protein
MLLLYYFVLKLHTFVISLVRFSRFFILLFARSLFVRSFSVFSFSLVLCSLIFFVVSLFFVYLSQDSRLNRKKIIKTFV